MAIAKYDWDAAPQVVLDLRDDLETYLGSGALSVDLEGPEGMVGIWFASGDAPEDFDIIGAGHSVSEALEDAIKDARKRYDAQPVKSVDAVNQTVRK